MTRQVKLRTLLIVATMLAVTFGLVSTASASTSSIRPDRSGSVGSVHLVVSPVPLPGPLTPAISRVNCSSGNDPNWARLYLNNGGAECYGDKGTRGGLNDGPAYQFCSGNNEGEVSVFVAGGVQFFPFNPIDNYSPNYYYFEDGNGNILNFYVRTITIYGWTGSATCP